MAIRNARSQTKEATGVIRGVRSQELGASRRSQEPGSDEGASSEEPEAIRSFQQPGEKGRRQEKE